MLIKALPVGPYPNVGSKQRTKHHVVNILRFMSAVTAVIMYFAKTLSVTSKLFMVHHQLCPFCWLPNVNSLFNSTACNVVFMLASFNTSPSDSFFRARTRNFFQIDSLFILFHFVFCQFICVFVLDDPWAKFSSSKQYFRSTLSGL